MSLQQRYQRLGRNDSWSASFRDTVLLVIGLPLALAGAGMLVTSKEAGEAQVQAVRAARAPVLTATSQPRAARSARADEPRLMRSKNVMLTEPLMTEPEAESETVADQPITPTPTKRRTEW